jgi:LysM repeat protein
MRSDDPFYDNSTEDIDESDLLEEPDYAAWEKKKSLKQYWMPLTLGGMGIFFLAFIFAWIFVKPQHPVDVERMERLETRLAALEEKLALLDSLDAKMIAMETQHQRFQSTVDRFDQAESSMVRRMDLLAKKIEVLQNLPPAQPSAQTAPPPAAEATQPAPAQPPSTPQTPQTQPDSETAEHVVSAGDTLYSISRKYGLSVAELLKYNDLPEGTIIYPGQKLVIAPSQ